MASVAKSSVDAAGDKTKDMDKKMRRQRRNSRDLEVTAFGMFLQENESIDAAFKRFDTDGSGGVSESELREACALIPGADLSGVSNTVFKNMIKQMADLPADAKQKTEMSLAAFKELVGLIKANDIERFKLSDEERYAGHFTAAAGGKTELSDTEILEPVTIASREDSFEVPPYNVLKKILARYATEKGGKQTFTLDAYKSIVLAIKTDDFDKE